MERLDCDHAEIRVTGTKNSSTFPQYDCDMFRDTIQCTNCKAEWQEGEPDIYLRVGVKHV